MHEFILTLSAAKGKDLEFSPTWEASDFLCSSVMNQGITIVDLPAQPQAGT